VAIDPKRKCTILRTLPEREKRCRTTTTTKNQYDSKNSAREGKEMQDNNNYKKSTSPTATTAKIPYKKLCYLKPFVETSDAIFWRLTKQRLS